MKTKIDIRDFSLKELDILDFFARGLKESPQELKEHLRNTPINDRCRTLAFLSRIPKLHKAITDLLESED